MSDDDMVSADAARELLEGSTPGPWCAGRSSSGSLCIAQMADPGEDVAVALDAIFADAALMAAAPDLARTVVALHERVAAVEAERDRMREREEHFTRVLSVTDGGQYRADWDSAIRRVVAERDGALAHAEELTQALREAQRARDAAAQAFDDLVATVWRAATGDEHEPPGSTGALVESVRALRETQRERDALRAIVEGRTTPPTDEEIASHHATRGRWYVADHAGGGEVRGYPPTVREIAGWHRERAATWRWCALDSHGRPCAWPEGA